MARYYKNRKTGGRFGKDRRLEYRGNENNRKKRIIKERNGQNNLNGDRDLIVLN